MLADAVSMTLAAKRASSKHLEAKPSPTSSSYIHKCMLNDGGKATELTSTPAEPGAMDAGDEVVLSIASPT